MFSYYFYHYRKRIKIYKIKKIPGVSIQSFIRLLLYKNVNVLFVVERLKLKHNITISTSSAYIFFEMNMPQKNKTCISLCDGNAIYYKYIFLGNTLTQTLSFTIPLIHLLFVFLRICVAHDAMSCLP